MVKGLEHYKYNAMSVPVSFDMAEEIRAAKRVEAILTARVNQEWREMQWMVADDLEHGHLGPRFRPTRAQVWEARENLERWAKYDRWKRSAGTYRRAPR